jgi:hypothetical protein
MTKDEADAIRFEYWCGDRAKCADCDYYDVDYQGDPLMPVAICYAEDDPFKCPVVGRRVNGEV